MAELLSIHSHLALEGLAMNVTLSSSLVQVSEYQNATLYVDLSRNRLYRGFKVTNTLVISALTLN